MVGAIHKKYGTPIIALQPQAQQFGPQSSKGPIIQWPQQ